MKQQRSARKDMVTSVHKTTAAAIVAPQQLKLGVKHALRTAIEHALAAEALRQREETEDRYQALLRQIYDAVESRQWEQIKAAVMAAAAPVDKISSTDVVWAQQVLASPAARRADTPPDAPQRL